MTLNLHPPLSGFPVALCISVVALEIIALFKSSQVLSNAVQVNLILLLLSTIAAFYSGYQAADSANISFQVPEEALAFHHNLGRLALFVVIPTVALRFIATAARHARKAFLTGYYLLLLTLCSLIVWTGFEGGQLVFRHGAGISVSKSSNE